MLGRRRSRSSSRRWELSRAPELSGTPGCWCPGVRWARSSERGLGLSRALSDVREQVSLVAGIELALAVANDQSHCVLSALLGLPGVVRYVESSAGVGERQRPPLLPPQGGSTS